MGFLTHYLLVISVLLGALASLADTNFDQIIFLQVAQRFKHGQLPYLDFWIPQGPIAGWLLSLLLRFFGPGWSLVISSSLLNSASTLLCYGILRAGGVHKTTAFSAALITSISFLAPFGGYYNDHLAYVFILAGFFVFLISTQEPQTGFERICAKPHNSCIRYLSIFGVGFFFALAYHTKQTVGILGLSILLLSILFFSRQRIKKCSLYGLSFFISLLLILCYFGTWKFIDDYYNYSVLAPLWYKQSTHTKDFNRLWQALVFPWLIDPLKTVFEKGIGRVLFLPAVLVSYLSYYQLIQFRNSRQNRILFFALFTTLTCSALLGRHYGHLYLGLGIVGGLAYDRIPAYRLSKIFFFILIVGQMTLSISEWGTRWNQPYESTKTPFFPLRLSKTKVLEDSLDILKHIEPSSSIAVLGTETYLLGSLADIENRNPNIYYQPYLTFPLKEPYREKWELSWIRKVLQTSQIIVDRKWLNYYKYAFPNLSSFLNKNYQIKYQNRIFDVLEIRATSFLSFQKVNSSVPVSIVETQIR